MCKPNREEINQKENFGSSFLVDISKESLLLWKEVNEYDGKIVESKWYRHRHSRYGTHAYNVLSELNSLLLDDWHSIISQYDMV